MILTARTRAPTHWQAYVALGVGVLCIGLSAILVKIAAVPGPVSAFYRMATASLVLVPWWLLRRRALVAPLSGYVVGGTILGGLFFALDLLLWNTALLIAPAGIATLLANNAPIWVGLLAWFFLQERLSIHFWLGLLAALVGMVLIMGSNALSLTAGEGGQLGYWLALVASFFYALYLLTTQRVRVRLDTLSFMTFSGLAATAVLGVTCLAGGLSLWGFSLGTWAALGALGLVSQVGGWLAINYALGHIPATRVSVTLLAQAVVTTLLAIPILQELPTGWQLAGGVLVLAGIYWVYHGREPSRPARRLT